METLNLKEFVEALEGEPVKKYAVAVIDNAPPSVPSLPFVGKNFIWIAKTGSIPTNREELEHLFRSYDIELGLKQPIAIFHHHDLDQPYLEFEGGVECYEFSHVSKLSYEAFCHADAILLSHMLAKTFHKHDKIMLVKSNLEKIEIEKMQQKYWFLGLSDKDCERIEELSVDKEDFLLYRIASCMGSGQVIPDPKRYLPEVHDEIFKLGLPVDMYAIPSMFNGIEIRTGTKLDEKVASRMLTLKTDWQKRVKEVKKQKKEGLARIAQEEKLREQGELVPADAVSYIDSIAPALGYDYTKEPVYPLTRKNIAAVKRTVENGGSYGYDIIYLVWQTTDGIKSKQLIDSTLTKDYIHIHSIIVTENDIQVEVGSGGSYSGSSWEKTIKIAFAELVGVESEKPKNELERLSKGLESRLKTLSEI